MACRRDLGERAGERLRGVRRTKSGKYGSVIRDPIMKKQVWLGSFDNAEEAANAYLSKKSELEEQLKAKQAVQLQPIEIKESGCRNMTSRMDSGEKSKRLRGVRSRKSGKYTSEILDPIRKKKFWLGTFRTAEEAANAYLSKKREFQELLKVKHIVQQQPILSQDADLRKTCRRDLGEKSGERLRGVRRTKSGKYDSVIRDPIMKKQVWLGSFDNAEEAANAYLSKKSEFEEQLEAKQAVQLQPIEIKESGCRNMTDRMDSGEKSKRLRGVFRRKSGKYTSEIQDPIRKKKIWLGTFRTAEEAANAYLSKKHDFQELKAKQVVQHQPILNQESGCRDMTYTRDLGEKSRKKLHEVTRRKTGRFTATARYPTNWETVQFGTHGTSEEAANAYCSRQLEFDVKHGVQHTFCRESELEPSHESPSSAPEKAAYTSHSSPDHHGAESETCYANTGFEVVKLENNEGCTMGLFKLVPSYQGANVGSEIICPILDNNGFLLGEFSKLDDLSICQNEDDSVPSKF